MAPRHRNKPDPLAAAIGARIRRMRREQEFSFDAFVEETGLGRGYVSELERGLVVPGIGALSRIAAALEVTLADLVIGNSDRERLFDDTRTLPTPAIRKLREHTARLLKENGGSDSE